MTVLGKNPALFSGSVRKNLQVIEPFQDAELWQALEQEQEKGGSVGLRVVGEWCKFKYRRTETNLLGSRPMCCPPCRLLEGTFGRGLQCLPLQQNNFFLTHWLFIAWQCNILLASCSHNSPSKMVVVLSLHCCRNLAFILNSKPIFSAQINAYASLL